MGLETVTDINDLDISNPLGTDPRSQGDDHIRNIKKALKTDFPSITGAMTATQAELNVLDGVTAGTVTASKGVVVDATSKVDVWNVDNLTIDGNTLTANTGAINITPAAGSAIVLDATINVDAGVVTGATSITSTTFSGDLTGAVTGNADTATSATTAGTVTTAAQTAITSLGTLTALQTDNININGNTIISTDTAGNINVTPDTTGDLILDGVKWPQADGTANQFLQTDGAGQSSWFTGTPAAGVVTETGTQTLTNKTITALKVGVSAGNTANVNSAQGDNPITTTFYEIATCANAGDACTLPTAAAGLVVIVANNGAESADVFPASGDDIDKAGVNTAYALASGSNTIFICEDTLDWDTVSGGSKDLTTKGDLQGFSTVGARIPVGNDGEIVLANSSSALGVVYVPYSGKNFIHNGAFRVATRGTSFTAATSPLNSDGVALLDRWGLLSDGNDIVDVTQGTDGAVGNGTYCQADVETVSKKFGFLQIMENLEVQELLSLSDVVSLSFNALVSDATKLSRIKAMIVSWDGTVDVPTADIVSAWGVEGTSPTMVANWTIEGDSGDLGVTASDVRYNLENVAIDTASVKNLGVFIWSDDVATNDTLGTLLKITNVKLEKGPIATPFQDVGIEVEKSRCRRFAYWFTQCIGWTDGFTSWAWKLYGKFPEPMRKSPTMTALAAVTTRNLALNAAGPTTIATSLTANIEGLDSGTYVVFGAGATFNEEYTVTGTFKAEADFF